MTWSNKSPGDRLISRKLDIALINQSWNDAFPRSQAEFLPPGVSDHSMILVRTGLQQGKRSKPFKFFNYWADNPKFEEIVQEVWNYQIDGSLLFQITKKLRILKAHLRKLNRDQYFDITSKKSEARKALFDIQNEVSLDPSNPALRLREKSALSQLISLSYSEEKFFKQKARVQWLAEGDLNTGYFHKVVKKRQQRNKVASLNRSDGSLILESEEIKAEAVGYYKNLLDAGVSLPYPGRPDFEQLLSRKLSIGQQSDLGREVMLEEIKQTFLSLHSKKAPTF